METFLAANNQITDLFELTYLSKLKNLDIENNKLTDKENLNFLNMIDSLENINISNNHLIDELDIQTLNEYFYIQKEDLIINNKDNNNNHLLKVDESNREKFDKYNLKDLKNKYNELNLQIWIKATNSKIIICKLILYKIIIS